MLLSSALLRNVGVSLVFMTGFIFLNVCIFNISYPSFTALTWWSAELTGRFSRQACTKLLVSEMLNITCIAWNGSCWKWNELKNEEIRNARKRCSFMSKFRLWTVVLNQDDIIKKCIASCLNINCSHCLYKVKCLLNVTVCFLCFVCLSSLCP